MNITRFAAAALAVSLTAAMAGTAHAEEAPANLETRINTAITELQAPGDHGQSMIDRIDVLVAEIDARLEAGLGNQDELLAARNRLLYARGKIVRQLNGETLINAANAPLAGGPSILEGPLDGLGSDSGYHHVGGGGGGGFSGGGGGGGFSGGGGGGIGGGGGFGGLGLLGGIAAAFAAVADDDDNNFPGLPASPSGP